MARSEECKNAKITFFGNVYNPGSDKLPYFVCSISYLISATVPQARWGVFDPFDFYNFLRSMV